MSDINDYIGIYKNCVEFDEPIEYTPIDVQSINGNALQHPDAYTHL